MGATPKYGLPYPEADTLITESAAIVKELAEKIEATVQGLAIATAPSSEYTVTGALVDTLTTSQTWTPPAGVTTAHLIIVGGGRSGQGGSGDIMVGYYNGGAGGSGGQVLSVPNVDVSNGLTVTIGGANTDTVVNGIRAYAGRAFPGFWPWNTAQPGMNAWHPAIAGVGRGATSGWRGASGSGGERTPGLNASDGTLIHAPEGDYYLASGGGGGSYSARYTATGDQTVGWPGGVHGGRGGARAENPDGTGSWYGGTAGVNGTGSGGGAQGCGFTGGAGAGGSGVVKIYTTQPHKAARAPRVLDPHIVAALNADGLVLGLYAVDETAPTLPGVPYVDLATLPTDPIDTGRTTTTPADPDDPDGPTVEAPVLAWPVAGWTYTDTDGWKEPA